MGGGRWIYFRMCDSICLLLSLLSAETLSSFRLVLKVISNLCFRSLQAFFVLEQACPVCWTSLNTLKFRISPPSGSSRQPRCAYYMSVAINVYDL